ncbi:NAD(P)-dependent oxidoreductase [Cyanothece sp. BG0011]|uniref:NAD-dependent epimerase/dehydratase family protein n=1 Tax=Cyanothece sp. BG0011 TaxID=2082950 RepID=UPI000D1EDB5E|nr:NAD(P)-dependent oxidoreductase [Cyanothece sp. BG0011]
MSQTILVTGATGFLGSHLVKGLLKQGHKVIIMKRSFSNTWRLQEILPLLISYDLDTIDFTQPFQDIPSIDAIIHTATCYGRNKENISYLAQTNTLFPLQLLERAIKYNIPTFINTDTVLDKFLNPYALSKKHLREWGQYFANLEKIRFVNIKLEHMYGEDDDDSKFTSYVINSCLNNVKKLELTAGEQKRDFIYIEDVVSAYLILLDQAHQQSGYFQDYELGSGEAVSIRELVEMIHKMTQSRTKLNFGVIPYRPQEVMHSQADISQLTSLGWQLQSTLEQGLLSTINAYLNRHQHS